MLALSFRESRDRVPCIHPAHGCPLSPAAGDGCFPAGVHWCYTWLRIHSTLWPLATQTTMHSSRLQPAFIAPDPCPPPPFQPALCPRLHILVPVTVGIPPPPPPKLTQVYTHPSLVHVYGCIVAYGIVGACALGHLRARDSLPAHQIEAGEFSLCLCLFFLTLTLSVSLCLCLSLSVSISISLFLPLSLCIYLSPSLSLSIYLSLVVRAQPRTCC